MGVDNVGFRFGFFTGLVLGVIIALMLTPQTGMETRRFLLERARQRAIRRRQSAPTDSPVRATPE